MLTLITGAEVYAPIPLGTTDVLVDHDKIIKVGPADRRGLDLLGVEHEIIEAQGCVVVPGLIDPHEHLLGGSGEGSLALQSPMIFLSEIVRFGITTVVGVLGVDTTMKTMAGLLARVKGLHEEGLSTRMWTGGYNVPPTSVMSSVREDIMFIDEIVGTGEVAIADPRSLGASTHELAKVVKDTHVGGLLAGKAGITHFHVGEGNARLKQLRELVEEYEVEAAQLYPTHVERTEQLMDEALEFATARAYVDIDCVNGDAHRWIKYYLAHGGPAEQLTLSSDSGMSAPRGLTEAVSDAVLCHGIPLEVILPMVTSNTADALRLEKKGRIASGLDADLVVLEGGTLAVREVMAMGRRMVRDGRLVVREQFLEKSTRSIELYGQANDE